MPVRNGHALAVSLLEQPNPPMVVAVTGVTEPQLANHLLARGVADVIFKPINYFDMADRLSHMLESLHLSRQIAMGPVAATRLSTSVETTPIDVHLFALHTP